MVTVYGASDDLIEVEGDIREEFYVTDDKEHVLAFSDGTVLGIEYDRHGMWRIRRLAKGRAAYKHTEATDADKNYTDTVELDGEITWVAFGAKWAKKEDQGRSDSDLPA